MEYATAQMYFDHIVEVLLDFSKCPLCLGTCCLQQQVSSWLEVSLNIHLSHIYRKLWVQTALNLPAVHWLLSFPLI